MSQIEVKYIFEILKIVFVIFILGNIYDRKNKMFDCLVFGTVNILGIFIFEKDGYKGYIIKNIYSIIILILYMMKNKIRVMRNMSLLCIILSVFEISKILIGFLSGLSIIFVGGKYISEQMIVSFSTIFFMIIEIKICNYILKNKVLKLEISFLNKYIAYFIYIFVICIKIPFLYTELRDAYTTKLVFIAIICCTVIFFIISKIEKYNADKERALIEENNKILSTKLHKAQEILPAMVQAVSDVVENNGKEMEGQQAQKLLEEMTSMYGQNLKENSKEDLQLKNFCSTGLTLLDRQLKGYQMEASDKNINLDIFVQAPINEIMKKNGIDQWKLQRAVGDMVRNAFRVEESEDKKCRVNKHILLIIGCRYEDVLEVAVLDNGKPFPLHVIETFGKRGVTTGGTGNGLADLVEFADETNASICVEEFAWETNSFTKKVSIIFDFRRLNYFNSPRETSIKNVFWNKN